LEKEKYDRRQKEEI